MTLPIARVSKQILGRARRVREDLHRHPELGYEETRTASIVVRALRAAGIRELRTGIGTTGVVAVLRGARPGPTVGLRADMDALPIEERTGLPYASANKGVMHACGHDGHTTVLLAVAEVLSGMRDRMAGNVKFVFQPAEEGGGGAVHMVKAGCLKDPDVDAVFALHALSPAPVGRVEVSLTPNAAVNGFQIDITGKGGHGAHPDECVDPVFAGAQIITASQGIVSRERKADVPLVLSFCAFNSGTKDNIIPGSARLLGTIRAMDMAYMRRVRRRLERVARGVGEALRAKVRVTDGQLYPPVKNDARETELVRRVAEELLGKANVRWSRQQSMGGEDFAYYLADQGGAPGCIFRFGVGSEAVLHSPTFDFGSAALEPAILLMANVALRALEGSY